ncbi:hypothetical protein BT69DRAFT_1291392, partial [Atractiella rhizophila]
PLVDSFQRRPRHRASFHPKFAKWHLPTVITAKISIIPSSSTTPPNDASRRISISNAPNLLQPPFSFPPNDESRLCAWHPEYLGGAYEYFQSLSARRRRFVHFFTHLGTG